MAAADFRDRLLDCLGGDWPEPGPLLVEHRGTTDGNGFTIESVTYAADGSDRIPALLLVPRGVDAAHPGPAIAVWHQHNGDWDIGKSEPAGLAGDPMHHTGAALAAEGYVVLCPDAVGFEERTDPTGLLSGGGYERFEFLRHVVAGRSLAWKNILDARRAVDFLVSRPEVDPSRIGCYGHSMGSTHAWLVAPFEPRIGCVVGNCCLPTMAAIEEHRLLHCFSNFVPGLIRHGDVPDIAALIAPRPLLLTFGERDRGSPIDHVRRGLPVIEAAYADAGEPDSFQAFIEPGAGHVLSAQMWQRATSWFSTHLGPNAT